MAGRSFSLLAFSVIRHLPTVISNLSKLKVSAAVKIFQLFRHGV